MVPNKPNILFVFPDQLRHDALGCYGHPSAITPHIDALAAAGTRFADCSSTNPVCLPSRTSIITGKYCSQHHCHSNGAIPAASEVCWPALLRDSGYYTALVGKLHLWEQYRNPCFTAIDHGFQYKQMVEGKASFGSGVEESGWYFDCLTDHGLPPPHRWQNDAQCVRQGNARISEYDEWNHIDGLIGTRAVRQILEGRKLSRQRKKPFCMQVGICSPHDPYDPPQRFFDLYEGVAIPDPVLDPRHNATKSPAFQKFLQQSAKQVGFSLDGYEGEALQRVRFMQRCYLANVSFVDHQVGRLVQALKDADVYEQTAIIFVSDHGDFVGQRGGIQKWMQGVYQDNLHVPLIIHAPFLQTAPAVVHSHVQTLDLFATILDLAGLPIPARTLSRSLLPLLREPTQAVRDASFAECFDRKMVRQGRWKLIVENDPQGVELYDLENDPGETVNLARDTNNPTQPTRDGERLAIMNLLLRRLVQWQHDCQGVAVSR